MEPFRLEKAFKIIKTNCKYTIAKHTTVPCSLVQYLHSF